MNDTTTVIRTAMATNNTNSLAKCPRQLSLERTQAYIHTEHLRQKFYWESTGILCIGLVLGLGLTLGSSRWKTCTQPEKNDNLPGLLNIVLTVQSTRWYITNRHGVGWHLTALRHTLRHTSVYTQTQRTSNKLFTTTRWRHSSANLRRFTSWKSGKQ